MNNCRDCGLPQFYGPHGYIGPTCGCISHLPYRYWPQPPAQQERPTLKHYMQQPLTEDDVRRIVREELSKRGAK
jgi:hypothetical protein